MDGRTSHWQSRRDCQDRHVKALAETPEGERLWWESVGRERVKSKCPVCRKEFVRLSKHKVHGYGCAPPQRSEVLGLQI